MVTMQTTLSFLRRPVKKNWNTSDFNLDVKYKQQLVLWGNSKADIYGKDDWGLLRWHFHIVFCIVWAGLVSLSESTAWRQIWQTWDQTADKNSLFQSDPSQPLMPQITHCLPEILPLSVLLQASKPKIALTEHMIVKNVKKWNASVTQVL